MLMTFPSIRHIEKACSRRRTCGRGRKLSGSHAFSNLLAGVQISDHQPIRLERLRRRRGRIGWIEQITTTYVSCDLGPTGLVVPLTYFIERPFRTGTRRTADLLANVLVYTDYSAPVDDIDGSCMKSAALRLWMAKSGTCKSPMPQTDPWSCAHS